MALDAAELESASLKETLEQTRHRLEDQDRHEISPRSGRPMSLSQDGDEIDELGLEDLDGSE